MLSSFTMPPPPTMGHGETLLAWCSGPGASVEMTFKHPALHTGPLFELFVCFIRLIFEKGQKKIFAQIYERPGRIQTCTLSTYRVRRCPQTIKQTPDSPGALWQTQPWISTRASMNSCTGCESLCCTSASRPYLYPLESLLWQLVSLPSSLSPFWGDKI